MRNIRHKLRIDWFRNIELFLEELKIVEKKFPNGGFVTRIYWKFPENNTAQVIIVDSEILRMYIRGESHRQEQ